MKSIRQMDQVEVAFANCEKSCGKTPEERKAKNCPVFNYTIEDTPLSGTLCDTAKKILGQIPIC